MMETVFAWAVRAGGSALEAMGALAIPFLVFLALALVVKRRALCADLRRVWRQSVLNLKLILFNVIFMAPVLVLLSDWLHQVAATHDLVLVDKAVWTGLPALAVAFIAVFVGDFVGYWRHRLEHTPLLWPSHAVHHSDDAMTWLTLERFHPLNKLTTFIIDTGALVLLGLPVYAVIINNMVRHYYGFFIHADLPWTYGRANLIFVSPAMHRWHHAADRHYFQKNFATVFSVFDRAFGTYAVPGPCTAPLGVTDKMNTTLIGQLSYMFSRRAYRRLFDGTATVFGWRASERPAPRNLL